MRGEPVDLGQLPQRFSEEVDEKLAAATGKIAELKAHSSVRAWKMCQSVPSRLWFTGPSLP